MPDPAGSDRLHFRRYAASDEDAYVAVYDDDEVLAFIWYPGRPRPDADGLRAHFRTGLAAPRKDDRYGRWAIVERASERIVGTVMLQPLAGRDGDIEIGWHLGRSSWGKGYASEAAGAILRYGFEEIGLDRIVAVVDPENTGSAAVARRIGMRAEGRVRAYDIDGLDYFVIDRPGEGTGPR